MLSIQTKKAFEVYNNKIFLANWQQSQGLIKAYYVYQFVELIHGGPPPPSLNYFFFFFSSFAEFTFLVAKAREPMIQNHLEYIVTDG